jgi:hypothetical protein
VGDVTIPICGFKACTFSAVKEDVFTVPLECCGEKMPKNQILPANEIGGII